MFFETSNRKLTGRSLKIITKCFNIFEILCLVPFQITVFCVNETLPPTVSLSTTHSVFSLSLSPLLQSSPSHCGCYRTVTSQLSSKSLDIVLSLTMSLCTQASSAIEVIAFIWTSSYSWWQWGFELRLSSASMFINHCVNGMHYTQSMCKWVQRTL